MRNVFRQTTTLGVVSSAGLMRCYSSLFHFLAKFAQLGLPSHYHPASSWEPQKLCSADHGRDSPKPWARINVSVYKLIHRFCYINGKLANTKPAAVRKQSLTSFERGSSCKIHTEIRTKQRELACCSVEWLTEFMKHSFSFLSLHVLKYHTAA